MPEMHLRQPIFAYGTCWLFAKKKKGSKHFKKQNIHDIFIKTS